MNYPENSTTTVATYSITDPEGDDVTWSIAGTDAARFSIKFDSGELTFKSSPNYEAPNDANKDNVYEVTVAGTRDSQSSDSDLMSTLERGSNRHERQRIRQHHRPRVRGIPRERAPQPSPPTPSLTLTATMSRGASQARTQHDSPSTRTANSHSVHRRTTKPRTTPTQTTRTR